MFLPVDADSGFLYHDASFHGGSVFPAGTPGCVPLKLKQKEDSWQQ
jgi:hypothetical protein